MSDGCLIVAGAFLSCAVEIVVARNAGLDGGLDDGIDDLVLEVRIGDLQRSTDAVERVFAALLIFSLAEVGQDALIIPAIAAELASLRPGP